MEKSLEERITAMEVAIKFLNTQIEELKTLVLDIRNQLTERQTENGVQNATLRQHGADLAELATRLDKVEGRMSNLSKLVYIGLGILSSITFLAQVIIPLVK